MFILYENNKAFILTNGGKTSSFFLFPPAILDNGSQLKKNRKDFFVGRVERDVAPSLLSNKELYDAMSQYDDIMFGFQSGKRKFPGFGVTHN
jgi:hypothetical protein